MRQIKSFHLFFTFIRASSVANTRKKMKKLLLISFRAILFKLFVAHHHRIAAHFIIFIIFSDSSIILTFLGMFHVQHIPAQAKRVFWPSCMAKTFCVCEDTCCNESHWDQKTNDIFWLAPAPKISLKFFLQFFSAWIQIAMIYSFPFAVSVFSAVFPFRVLCRIALFIFFFHTARSLN